MQWFTFPNHLNFEPAKRCKYFSVRNKDWLKSKKKKFSLLLQIVSFIFQTIGFLLLQGGETSDSGRMAVVAFLLFGVARQFFSKILLVGSL